MLYSQPQATNCVRFHIDASLIPIPIPISYRIHTDFIPISIPIPISRYFGRKIPIPIPNSKSHTDSSLQYINFIGHQILQCPIHRISLGVARRDKHQRPSCVTLERSCRGSTVFAPGSFRLTAKWQIERD